MKQTLLQLLAAAAFCTPLLAAQPTEPKTPAPIKVDSKIESIALFKNGLAYVKRTITVDRLATYSVTDVPEPVYGTFWIESKTVDATVRVAAVADSVPIKHPGTSLEDDFSGKQVTIYLKGDKQNSPLSGTLIAPKPEKAHNWSRNYNSNNYYYNYRASTVSTPTPTNRFLRLRTNKGITMLDRSMIAYIESGGTNKTKAIMRPSLIFKVKTMKKAENHKIQISYLTKGISWAASYLVDTSDDKRLTIQQKAVIKNEFAAFADTEVSLISGFPNIKFSHVTSPLSPTTSWSNFFQQLNQRVNQGNGVNYNVTMQQAVTTNMAMRSPSVTPSLPGQQSEGVDIHYQSIGKQSLEEGDSMMLNVAKAEADYERIVLWDIPDNRRANGQYVRDYERRNNPGMYEDSVWDSLRFKNPFTFPMTTAAVSFVKNGNFLGESISYWVNPNEETVIKTNKALSISPKCTEKEIPGKRERLTIFGDSYQKTQVEGTLIIKSFRKKVVKLMIKRRFSGELIKADDNPKCELREAGVYSINKRNELVWELTLKPGEEKKLTYTYEVLVDI